MSAYNSTIKEFKDLIAWKESHALTLKIYGITKTFPQDERFGLTNQIRRAVVSVESNIAEGFGRSTQKDKIHFYTTAKSSLYEVQSQMQIAYDLCYCTNIEFVGFDTQSRLVSKLIAGLIKSASTRI